MGYTGVDIFICHDSFVYTLSFVQNFHPLKEWEKDMLRSRRLSMICTPYSICLMKMHRRSLAPAAASTAFYIYAHAKSGSQRAIGEC